MTSDETDKVVSQRDCSSSATSEEWITLASKYALDEWWDEVAEAYGRALNSDRDNASLWARYGDALLNCSQEVEAAQGLSRERLDP